MSVIMYIACLLLSCILGQAAPAENPSVEGPIDFPTLQIRNTVWEGAATYYYQGGVAGSCGQYHSDYDMVASVSAQSPFVYNAYCGQTVTITNTGGGQDNNGVGNKTVAVVADTCAGCTDSHLDLSVGAFEALTGGSLDPPGTFDIEWYFN